MKLRPFELALVVIFIVLFITALILLATFEGEPEVAEGEVAVIGAVQIWGTLPQESVGGVLAELADNSDAWLNVTYREIDRDRFDSQLVNALADGTGPDLVLVSQERLVDLRRRIQPISYESFPIRDFQDLYVDGARVWGLTDGLYGYPIAVDPLMMYWNRDMFATEGFLDAPQTWTTIVNTTLPTIVRRDFERTVLRSALAMGEYDNVRNAFGIISTLLIQGGSQLILEDSDGRYLIRIRSSQTQTDDPLLAAAEFYTRFGDPSNSLYTWNRSFESDRQEFVSEDLAIYFGYGSESRQLERINPNLNYDIAEMPQGAGATLRRTYGRFYSIALLSSADNPRGAAGVMFNLGGETAAGQIAESANMAPAHRSLLTVGSNDTYGRVYYRSASIAYGWLNPNFQSMDDVFSTMTKDINENRQTPAGAVADVTGRMENLY